MRCGIGVFEQERGPVGLRDATSTKPATEMRAYASPIACTICDSRWIPTDHQPRAMNNSKGCPESRPRVMTQEMRDPRRQASAWSGMEAGND